LKASQKIEYCEGANTETAYGYRERCTRSEVEEMELKTKKLKLSL
jgi:hypothetical protein